MQTTTKKFLLLAPTLLLMAGCGDNPTATGRNDKAGKGTIQITSNVLSDRSVQYATADVKSAKVFLLATDNSTIASSALAADAAHYSNGVFSYSITNVPPGNYKAAIEFYNGSDPSTSTKIGSGASTDDNGAAAGDFTVVANQTVNVTFGTVTLIQNPTGNANSSVTVNSATEAAISFQ